MLEWPCPRIIPARAGFTRRRSRAAGRRADHPRSRGVYGTSTSMSTRAPGSSPLARGLRDSTTKRTWDRGIIPARAGFTPSGRQSRDGARDHPRSRGVYGYLHPRGGGPPGSSPLARGLPPARSPRARGARIIPARAGFTAGPTCVSPVTEWIIPARAGFTPPSRACSAGFSDHPRSRGVYAARFDPAPGP